MDKMDKIKSLQNLEKDIKDLNDSMIILNELVNDQQSELDTIEDSITYNKENIQLAERDLVKTKEYNEYIYNMANISNMSYIGLLGLIYFLLNKK